MIQNGPYWNKQHPDHDKAVQQVYTLREMLNAKEINNFNTPCNI